jgi:hypothetical protein
MGFELSEEDLAKKLEEYEKKKDKEHTKVKGMFEGLRLTQLSADQQTFLRLIEFIIDGFKNTRDDMIVLFKLHLMLSKRVTALEEKVKQLEETLRKFEEWK